MLSGYFCNMIDIILFIYSLSVSREKRRETQRVKELRKNVVSLKRVASDMSDTEKLLLCEDILKSIVDVRAREDLVECWRRNIIRLSSEALAN